MFCGVSTDESVDKMLGGVDWMPLFGPWPEDYGLYATHMGYLRFGDVNLKVYQLNDGQQVFDADSIEEAFG